MKPSSKEIIENISGLTSVEVEESRRVHGTNLLTEPPKESLFKKFIATFNDPLIRILLIATVLSIGISCYEFWHLGEGLHVFLEPAGIIVAVLLATCVGFAVEVNANKKFELLYHMSDDNPVKVKRDGHITEIPRRDIVVGDIVILDTGEEVPADGTLLESISLMVNESSLTGEPIAMKSVDPAHFQKDATYPTNEVMRGTTIAEGHGIMRVDRVGDATEYGKVYTAAQIENDIKTPLIQQFDRLGRFIAIASYIIGGLIIVGRLAIYRYNDFDFMSFIGYFLNSVMIAVTLIVVSVPEGLPMSVTLSLALSMKRMLATNNLVRKMHACETMGAATVICTDKTGTLTENRMSIYDTMFFGVNRGEELSNNELRDIIATGIAVNSTAYLDTSSDKVKTLGNPTEGALLMWLNASGIDYLKLREDAKIVGQIPFSTERKYMATLVDDGNANYNILYVKGAPEILLRLCKKISGGVTADEITQRLAQYQQMAMRTLGMAYATIDKKILLPADGKLDIFDLTYIGIVAISDPVRQEVPSAITDCSNAGIKVKIITGDTPGTAREIGRQVGLWNDATCTDRNIITGPEWAALSDEEARKRAGEIIIMSRARPSDKSRMVHFLQENGEVVAVTGDGTNDAPALNAAQVGLSMGDGTSVAKEASDITIMDNSFSSISRAVMWGRSLYANIQRFILFQLVVNFVACLLVLIGSFTSQQSPLTVTQMLWVNLIMDTFAALALSSLPPSADVMLNKPRRNTDFIITPQMVRFIVGVGIVFVAFLFGYNQYLHNFNGVTPKLWNLDGSIIRDYFRAYFDFHYDIENTVSPREVTYFFTTFVFLQFWNLFNAKAFMTHRSAFAHLRDSKIFLLTIAAIFIGQLVIVYAGGEMFNVTAIPLVDFLLIFLYTSVVLWVGEILRLIPRKKHAAK